MTTREQRDKNFWNGGKSLGCVNQDNDLHKCIVLSGSTFLDMHANWCICVTIYIEPSKNMVLRTSRLCKYVKWLRDYLTNVA